MGALSQAAEAVTARRKGPPCSVGQYLSTIDDDDRKLLLTWVEEKRQWEWIAAVLAEAGTRIRAGIISRHFRGVCACDG